MAEYRVKENNGGNEENKIENKENNASDDKILSKDNLNPNYIRGKAEINDKLAELLAILERKRYNFDININNGLTSVVEKSSGKKENDNNERNNNETAITTLSKPSEDNFQLLQQVRDAYCNSIYGNRTFDTIGKTKKAFGFLESPTKHLVSLQVDELDLFLKDGLSLAERCGCMDFFNTFNLIYTVARFSLFLLIYPWVCILVPCIIAGFFEPSNEFRILLVLLWNLLHISGGLWMFAYIFCYGNIEAMKVIIKANPIHAFWLIGSSVLYTISSIIYSPTIYNIPAVITLSFILTMHKFFFGSTVVFFKLRTTRKNYDFYFVPKGCFAKLWLYVDSLEIIADILRHLAILYGYQASLEAQGKNVHDRESLIGLTIASKAFQVTLRQVMNTSYTVSLIFRFSMMLQGVLKGDLGRRIHNVPGKKIVNVE